MSLETFTIAYIECALWSSPYGENGEANLDDGTYEVSPKLQASFEEDCKAFYGAHRDTIENAGVGDSHAGHDFWLTRCGHGAGFWDGDWPEPQATLLDKAAKEFGIVDLYVGDDDLIYGM
jgi:hypothetical protein